MFGQADTRHDHVQIVQFAGIGLCQHTGQKISLFLVVSFQNDPVARCDQFFQHGGKIAGRKDFAGQFCPADPVSFFLSPGVPFSRRNGLLHHGMSPFV